MAEYGQGIVNTTQVNLDVATVELTTLVETSTSISPATYYCNFPANTFSSILAQVMETDAQIVLSSGTFSEPALIDLSANVGLALVAPGVFPPITQFAFDLKASAPNIRLSHLEIYGETTLTSANSSVSHCLFADNVYIGQNTAGSITIENCEFTAGKPVVVDASFASVLNFYNCDFKLTSLVFNQPLASQVIIRSCRGLPYLTGINATLEGINTTGAFVQNNITVLTFEDGSTQATAVVIPENTVKNNMLIASETGELSWTPGPISAATYYVNDGVNDLSAVLAQVGAQQGAQIIVSSGSFGGAAINVTQDNLAIVGPNCSPPIVELIRAVTVSGTRIRITHIQMDGVATLTGNGCRYSYCDFPENVIVGSGTNTSYITLENCEFASGKTITINATGNTAPIYFINCNINGATVVVNSASPLQVIFGNCAGFITLPLTTKATFAGLNTTAAGVINNAIQRTILASGRGTAGQVLLSGGASANDTWGSAPADATKYDVSGGNITGNVTLSATKSITADILNIKTLNIGSPQYITASTGVINATASITKLSPGLNTSQAVTIANGTVDGFVKFIEIIDSNATSITITGANLHTTLSFTNSVGAGGQGAILVWDNDSEFWIATALNNGATGGGGGGNMNNPSLVDLVMNNNNITNVSTVSHPEYLNLNTTNEVSYINIATNTNFLTGSSSELYLQNDYISLGTYSNIGGGGGPQSKSITIDLNNDLTFVSGNQDIINTLGTTKSKSIVLTSGQGGNITFSDNTTQSTAGGNLPTPTIFVAQSSFSGAPASGFNTWTPIMWTLKLPTVANNNAAGVGLGETAAFLYVTVSGNYKITWSSSVYAAGYSVTSIFFQTPLPATTIYGTATNDTNSSGGLILTSTGTIVRYLTAYDTFYINHYTQNGDANGMGGPYVNLPNGSSLPVPPFTNTNAIVTIESLPS